MAQSIGIELVGLDAVFMAAPFPGEAVLIQTLRRPVNVKVAEPMNEILGAGIADQRRQRFECRANQGA